MIKTVSELPHIPGENPFIVARGGFYRRWLQMIDNIDDFKNIVSRVESTLESHWVPIGRKPVKNLKN